MRSVRHLHKNKKQNSKEEPGKNQTPGLFKRVWGTMGIPENLSKKGTAEYFLEMEGRKAGLSNREFEAKYGFTYRHTSPNAKTFMKSVIEHFTFKGGR